MSLEQVTPDLLGRIPDAWQEFDPDKLTVIEADALYRLVAAGLVEKRSRFRVRLLNHPTAIEAELTACGEFGIAEGLQPVVAASWQDWREAYGSWNASDADDPPFFCERLAGDAWRLTAQGIEARQDLQNGKVKAFLDFVLKRSLHNYRPPVPGEGRLVKLDRSNNGHCNAVAVANWEEGGKAFAAAFKEFLAREQAEGLAADTGEREQGKKTPKESNDNWSKPDSPSRWAKVFDVSATTFKRYVQTGKIKAEKMTDRRYRVAMEALPDGYKERLKQPG